MAIQYIILAGESHGQRSLAGYNPWGHKESDMTEQLNIHTHTHTHTHISPKLGIGLPWWIQGAKSCSGDARASVALNSPLLLLEAT